MVVGNVLARARQEMMRTLCAPFMPRAVAEVSGQP